MDVLSPDRLAYEHRDVSGSSLNINSVAGSQNVLIHHKSSIPLFRRTPRKNLEIFLIISLLFGILLLVALCTSLYILLTSGEILCQTEECIRSASNYLESMDQSVDPCSNFYRFSCGRWRDEHDLRDANIYNDWFMDRGWTQVKKIKEYLRKNDSDNEPDAVHQARILYRSCRDFESMEEHGLDRLISLLEEVGFSSFPPLNSTIGVDGNKTWLHYLTKMERLAGNNFLVAFAVANQPKNKTITKLAVAPPGSTEVLSSIRRKRRTEEIGEEWIMLKALKDADDLSIKLAKKSMEDIFNYFIEASNETIEDWKDQLDILSTDLIYLLRNISEIEDNGNVTSLSNNDIPDEMTLVEFQDLVDSASEKNQSKINWKLYFVSLYEELDVTLDFDGEDTILVYKKKYFELLSEFLDSIDNHLLELAVWWKIIYSFALHTNEELADLKDAYITKVLSRPSGKTRSTICAETVYSLMEAAVGYQVTNFKNAEKKKQKVTEMISDMETVYKSLVKKLKWMDRETKVAVVEKVDAMRKLIGFPEWFHDHEQMDLYYENITFNEETHLDNVLLLIKLKMEETLLSIRTPYNSDDFSFDPLDINAYYSFYDNYICVPEGILRYPFYDLGLEALNYGALGVILGHELTHGFDNIGRQFDKEGNLRAWWTNRSIEEYTSRTECYIEQYDNYSLPVIDSHVDGKLTLSENLADNGGIREAYMAYKHRLKIIGSEPKLPGLTHLTHDQLFFLSFANMWCSEYTDVGLMMQLLDEHSPHFVRVQMALRNFPEFSEAWKCKAGTNMNPRKKCKMWID